MSSDQQEIPIAVLDDLCSRFIINIPPEQRDDLVRIIFAVELAHWYYIDFYCEDNNDLHICSIKEFAQQIFQHCPFLRDYINNLDNILSQWREYKFSVPTYGAVLIDPTYKHVLLVQGYYARESWGFPKGKVQENESPLKCAIREVMEEIGFDMKDRAFKDQYLEHELNGQLVRLYIIKQVPLDTKFIAKTKNEIKEMRWFPIADLPSHRGDIASQMKLNLNSKAFFMVIPFIKDLRRWINQESNIDNQKSRTYSLQDDNKKLSNQFLAQRHFSQILKNDSITVTDNTSITETLLIKENTINLIQLTPPISNDDELNNCDTSQHDQRRQKPLSNLTNDIFCFSGPRCWTQFRLNRLEVFRCLHE